MCARQAWRLGDIYYCFGAYRSVRKLELLFALTESTRSGMRLARPWETF